MSALLPIYFINLASRQDRRAHFENELTRVGLQATRIEAVAVGDLSSAEIAEHCRPSGRHQILPVELACSKSHLQCWRALLSAPGAPEWALVLEDDGVLSKALAEFLMSFLSSEAQGSVDAVQLEVRRRPVRVLPPQWTISGRRLAPFRSTREGCACYLISRRAVSKLLARNDLFNQPIDLTLFRPRMEPGRSLNTVLADPGLCMQLDETGSLATSSLSDIEIARRARKKLNSEGPRKAVLSALRELNFSNLADHLRYLPAGLKRRVIPFDGDLPGRPEGTKGR